MALWQLDLVGAIYLADGPECKVLSGIDDHSRYMVCEAVLVVPSARAVADTFTAAMKIYGVPAEVLTDNGKQFTGRFTKPRPAEVLSEPMPVRGRPVATTMARYTSRRDSGAGRLMEHRLEQAAVSATTPGGAGDESLWADGNLDVVEPRRASNIVGFKNNLY